MGMVGVPSRPRVAILTAGNARHLRTWSGIPYFMGRALQRHVGETAFLGPFETHLLSALKATGRMSRMLTGQRSLPSHSERMVRHYARSAPPRLAAAAADLVLAPAASVLLAGLETVLPVTYTSDTTARLMFDYYPQFSGLRDSARRSADGIERRAIARADLLLYPTGWAARSAVEDYGADPAKVHVVPYGANLETLPERMPALAPRDRSKCRLLFVGVNWAVKGGAIAIDTLRCLRADGVDAELTIVGCVPPEPLEEPGLRVIPFLDKNDPGQSRQLGALYLAADFFLLPTRCECFGIVFCEASAHGVPIIATATGGVPGVVREGVNGHLLPHQSGGRDYAGLIRSIHADEGRLARLRKTSRDEFETRLNWDAWGSEAARLMAPLLATRAKAVPD